MSWYDQFCSKVNFVLSNETLGTELPYTFSEVAVRATIGDNGLFTA